MPLRSGWPPSARAARYGACCAINSDADKRIVAVTYLVVFIFCRFFRSRTAEFPSVHRNIEPYLIELKFVASSQPCEEDMERHFDSVHVPIIGVVDLGGNAANGRVAIAH